MTEISGARYHPPNWPRYRNRLESDDLGELVKMFYWIEADPRSVCWC